MTLIDYILAGALLTCAFWFVQIAVYGRQTASRATDVIRRARRLILDQNDELASARKAMMARRCGRCGGRMGKFCATCGAPAPVVSEVSP